MGLGARSAGKIMTSVKCAATAGLLLALAAAPASAQTVTAFTTQNVIQALTNIGATGAQAGTVNGQGGGQIVRFEANGLKHVAALEVCNAGAAGCLGLNIITIWNDVPGVDLGVLNDFNITYSFGKAVGVNSNMAVSRYAIADGGVSMKNLEANLSNHAGLAITFLEFYRSRSSASTVSLEAKGARPKAVQVSAPPGLEGLAPLLVPNDFNSLPAATAAPAATHVAPR